MAPSGRTSRSMRASRPSSADISSPAGTPPTLRLTRRLERIRRKPSITSTHYVVRTNAPRLPLWFNEGLAEFFSTFEYRKGELRIGLPKPSHVLWLRNHSAILIPALFAMDRDSKDYNEGTRRGIFYAQSWPLVHYLIARDSDLRSRIPDFLPASRRAFPGIKRSARRSGLPISGSSSTSSTATCGAASCPTGESCWIPTPSWPARPSRPGA